LEQLEPKLREAWIQMRRLDKKLARCTLRERTVKKETAALIEKNRAEINQLRLDANHKETKWEAENTAHFLALAYHDLDEELKSEMDAELGPSTPLFKTQVPYDCDNISMMDGDLGQSSGQQPFPPGAKPGDSR
jgi:hypothetical protein